MTDAEANPPDAPDGTPSIDLEDARGSELFFALVYPVGTDSEGVVHALTAALADVNYEAREIHLIETLAEDDEGDLYEKYSRRMDRGDEFRETLGRADCLRLSSSDQYRVGPKNDVFQTEPHCWKM